MGNRCYLYVQALQEENFTRCVAEGNNHLPTLWVILLAESRTGAAVEHQRVFGQLFGQGDSPGVQADARSALARLDAFCTFARRHPLVQSLDCLPRYLDAAVAFLRDAVAQCEADAPGAPVVFTADLDELTWLHGGTPEDCIAQYQDEFRQLWQDLQAAAANEAFHELDELLGFSDHRSDVTDWNGWCWTVGLASFDHPYFENADDEPRDVDYADFDEGVDEEDEDPWRWSRWTLVASDGLVGLAPRAGDDDDPDDGAPAAALPMQWNEILPADDHFNLAWVRRGDLWGLMNLRNGFALLLEPSLETTSSFDNGVAIVGRDGKQGLLDSRGAWVIEPLHERIWLPAHGQAAVRDGDRVGFRCTATGALSVPLVYDDAWDFAECGLTWVQKDGLWGLVRADGTLALAPQFDEVEELGGGPSMEGLQGPWEGDEVAPFTWGGWEVRRSGRLGLVRYDGSIGVPCEWEHVSPLGDTGLYHVVANGHHGVLGEVAGTGIDCTHEDLCWLGLASVAHAHRLKRGPQLARLVEWCPPAAGDAARWYFAVRSDHGIGVIDDRGGEIVPAVFEEAALMPTPGAAYGEPMEARWLQVGDTNGQRGLWDLQHRRELLPCRYDGLTLLDTANGGPLVLAWQHLPADENEDEDSLHFSYTFWRTDGTPVFDQAYAWVGSRDIFSLDLMPAMLSHRLLECWNKGKPVMACLRDEPAIVWIHPDHDPVPHADKLASDHAKGDLKAALTLARDHHAGELLPRDDAAALRWAAIAAGDASRGGSKRGLPEAMLFYAQLLEQGHGGEPDPRAALAWCEQAYAARHDAPALFNLMGHLLLQTECGQPDPARALQLFRSAAGGGDGTGHYNVGICLFHGWGAERDLEGAEQALRQADKLKERRAVGYLGYVLSARARATDDEPQAAAFRNEALYFARKACNTYDPDAEPDVWGDAQALAGAMLLETLPASQWAQAQPWLERAAQTGHEGAMDDLARWVHGRSDSGAYDPQRSAHWQQQLQSTRG